MDIRTLIRKHIDRQTLYKSSKHEFSGEAKVLLNANENPYGVANNRYPDPDHHDLREAIAKHLDFEPHHLFLGNGSDEVLDYIIRLFCEPKEDKIIIQPPTFLMYNHLAKLYNIDVVNIPLDKLNFDMELDKVLQAISDEIKMIFICHPNNPTGNAMSLNNIEKIVATAQHAIVVIDQAYIDFCPNLDASYLVKHFSNVIIIRTLSKAWGFAGGRIGYAISNKGIIDYLYQIKMPYNINKISSSIAIDILSKPQRIEKNIATILKQKEYLYKQLIRMDIVKKVYHSDANFFLVQFEQARAVFSYLLNHGIVVRSIIDNPYCKNTLRITIGKTAENKKIVAVLNSFQTEKR